MMASQFTVHPCYRSKLDTENKQVKETETTPAHSGPPAEGGNMSEMQYFDPMASSLCL